jgi:hypothetical protein
MAAWRIVRSCSGGASVVAPMTLASVGPVTAHTVVNTGLLLRQGKTGTALHFITGIPYYYWYLGLTKALLWIWEPGSVCNMLPCSNTVTNSKIAT